MTLLRVLGAVAEERDVLLASNTMTGITSAMLITSKGQVTIPQRIRNRYGLKPGTAVEFVAEGSKVVLKPKRRKATVADSWLAEARGFLKGKSTDKLMTLTRGED